MTNETLTKDYGTGIIFENRHTIIATYNLENGIKNAKIQILID